MNLVLFLHIQAELKLLKEMLRKTGCFTDRGKELILTLRQ
jgi:hypothetical protein